jgi:CHAT domain-containing protein
MSFKPILLFFFCVQFSFGQTVSLEDKIYNTVDVFVADPNAKNLVKLEQSEVTFQPKSKPELLAFVILKCNKAYYENQFGLTQKAIKSYEKAWFLYQKNKLTNYDIIESCLQPLGNLYTQIGDYDSAENTIKQYYFIANSNQNQQQKYAAILNLSNVYQNTGRIVEAINLIEKTLQTEPLNAVQKGNLWNNLGANYFFQNQFVSAQKAFQNSTQWLKNDTSQSKTLSNAYRNLAKIEAHENHFNKANTLMEIARNLFFQHPTNEPRQQAQLYYDIAFLNFKSAQLQKCQVNLNSVFAVLIPNYDIKKALLPKPNDLYSETVLLDALDLQAELFRAQHQPKKALESYQLAFHIEHLFQAMLRHENSKIITQIRHRNRTEKCLEIYYSLFQKEKRITYIEAAFLLAEQTKSAVLKQSLVDSKNQSREDKLIVSQLQNWNTIIVKEQQKLDDANISKINEAIQKQNELMLLLKSKESKASKTTKSFDLYDMYSKLEKDQAILVEYFAGKEHLYVFTIENQTIQLHIVAEKYGENSAIPKFLSFFKDANVIVENPKAFDHQAHIVYQLLQIPKSKSQQNLIIVPDGILHFFPFEALITKQSSTTSFSKMRFLLHDYTIGYANSAKFYLDSKPFKHQKESVLGVFPVFEKTNLELAFSKKEKLQVASYFEGMYLENKNATFQNFKQNVSNYSIIHLSTHASSGDVYEPSTLKFYNQDVMYSELYSLEMKPNLVVLSACETGIGKWFRAEGTMSVARGFQWAGAQNLLFSLWKVNDYTTSVLMDKFYRNVKNGNSYFESTNLAKLDYLLDKNIPNAKKSPYYWSAFVYYGTLENNDSSHFWIWVLVAVGIVIAVFFYKLFHRVKQRRHKVHKEN